jgi:8-oxo-dGTP pyrophosphatase MutT (NUDIX family)
MSDILGPGGEPVATPAATVIPLRDGAEGLEVLLLRRSRKGSFAGMWVFPGGRVDEADAQAAAHDAVPEVSLPGGAAVAGVGTEVPAELAAARRAAVREAEEEAAVRLDPEDLAVLSWWLPPEEAARRFSTWFFLAPFTEGEPVTVDQGEIYEHRWVRPADAIEARERGELAFVPPTWMTLLSLAGFPDVASAMAATRSTPPQQYVTRVVVGGSAELRATLWEGDVAWDDPTIGLDAPGPRRRLVLDPAGWRYEGPDLTGGVRPASGG